MWSEESWNAEITPAVESSYRVFWSPAFTLSEFLPQSWKWKIIQNEKETIIGDISFSTEPWLWEEEYLQRQLVMVKVRNWEASNVSPGLQEQP